ARRRLQAGGRGREGQGSGPRGGHDGVPVREAAGRAGQRPRRYGEGPAELEGGWLPHRRPAKSGGGGLFRVRPGGRVALALATAPRSGMSFSRGERGEGAGRLTETLSQSPKKEKRRDQRADMLRALNENKTLGTRVQHEGTFPLGATMTMEK